MRYTYGMEKSGLSRTEAARKMRARKRAERTLVDGRMTHPAPWGGHGSVTAYTSCSCRCAACGAAMHDHQSAKAGRKIPRGILHATRELQVDTATVFNYGGDDR